MTTSTANFSCIPILDYSLLSTTKPQPESRDQFINELRNALINVGFLYLKNHTVSQDTIDKLISYAPKLFDLPQGVKDNIRMENSEHFLGYSRLGTELTKGQVDQREQWNFGTGDRCRWQKGDPDYYRLWGKNQASWPDEALIPGFREMLETYLSQVEELSYDFSSLVAEALGLGPTGLKHFYDAKELMQHRGKIVKYPVVTSGSDQGIGPHYDGGFLTFLLQASPHQGLQVQNMSGEWIDALPIPGTFVINIGKALEFVTRGIAKATSHRVISPKGETPRYSVPFFQSISPDIRLANEILDNFPADVLKLRDERGTVSATDSVNFTEFDREPSGRVILLSKVK
ncbi:hypothetical protein NP233_g4959 [Leucocoprinus birnbaumii]|uniref:Fe2OG dioxygenase domain-containing protein n=1 Tax=Leucocoprinus birnbaumii TaxID=56174 RepID=A0AAD5VTU7_9AGAR|nr:hypothetical protein NP233_g4959 [Leucocoprinus birnbaumii]